MKKIIGFILMVVLFIYLILIFENYSEDYDKIYENVTFTAIENTANNEILYVHELIYEITDIHIDGVHYNVSETVVSINVTEAGEIVLINNASGTGDIIEIRYSYLSHPTEYTTKFIDTIPIIMVIILVSGLGYVLIKRR